MNPQTETTTRIPALRRALRRAFSLTAREAQGRCTPRPRARAVVEEITRRMEEVGAVQADVVMREAAIAHFSATGRCPFCGAVGECHWPPPSSGSPP